MTPPVAGRSPTAGVLPGGGGLDLRLAVPALAAWLVAWQGRLLPPAVLYGVAAVSSMGRIANRKHWVSDTVAGGIVGYAIGTILWKGQRDLDSRSRLTIMPGPKEISVAWHTKY